MNKTAGDKTSEPVCPYRNKAHRSAWKRGRAAALRGISPSFNPYRRTESTTLYFHKAWAAGYESASVKDKPA